MAMAISDQVRASGGPADKAVTAWYALTAEQVAAKLGAARAADLLAGHGLNALPVEQPPSVLRRFLAEASRWS